MALSGKTKRILIAVCAIVVLVPLLTVAVVLSRLGTIIKIGFEKVVPRVLGVQTRLDDATVYPLRGEVTLKGMVVGNPAGYKAPALLEADRVHVGANVTALLRNEVHVREILLDGPALTVEFKDGRTNIQALLDHLESKEKAPRPETAPKEKADEPLIKVDLVRVTNTRVNVMIGEKPVKITLPSIEIRDIADKDGNAVPPSRLAQTIVAGFARPLDEALRLSEIAGKISKELDRAGRKLDKAGKEVDKAAQVLKDAGVDVGVDVKETGRKILDDTKKMLEK